MFMLHCCLKLSPSFFSIVHVSSCRTKLFKFWEYEGKYLDQIYFANQNFSFYELYLVDNKYKYVITAPSFLYAET